MARTRIPYPTEPWPLLWEQMPGLDDCLHDWEPLSIEVRPLVWDDTCERCRRCQSPRCIRQGCIERRHHRTLHIFEDGAFEPVGGYLDDEDGVA
jgi:hypothetical protein